MKKYFLLLLLAVFGATLSVSAEQVPVNNETDAITSAFQKYKDISAPSIKVPTVVETTFSEDFANRFNFAILDTETNAFQPYYYVETLRSDRTPVSVSIQGSGSGSSQMLDGDTRTFAEFALPESTQGQTQLLITSARAITMSSLSLFLDQYVALPTFIEIRANTDSGEKIVLARSRMNSSSVVFPKTSAREWTIALTYGQPLRITELVLREEGAGVVSSRALRFLAQPKHNYRVYFDADRSVKMSVGEAGNLASNTDVMRLASVASQANAGYVLSDTDGDSIPDMRDNCVSTANTDQLDVNENGRGDACDDFDKDGVANSVDNCPNEPNRNQADVDNDKIGDICDEEESRITEKYPWLPWAGMGFAGLVLIVLFALTARSMMTKKEPEGPENQG